MGPNKYAKATIFICSLNRQASLDRLLDSLNKQTVRSFNIRICTEPGRLVELKDKLWREVGTELLIWLDDDVVCAPRWFEMLTGIFERNPTIVGVTGPTLVPQADLHSRDIFKYLDTHKWLRKFYDRVFLDGKMYTPGYISRAGAASIGANFVTETAKKIHDVDFMEPSQFALRRSVMAKIGGFDLGYDGVAEWCDVDLCFRAREYGRLMYHPAVQTFHHPVRDAVANKRLETASRYRNYLKFSKKFVQPSWRHYLYRLFLKTYFLGKQKGWL